jgi:ABC-type multidrug transport system permease subunit
VRIDNRDTGFLGGFLVEELSRQGLARVDATGAGQVAGEIRIASDFTARVESKQATKLELITQPGANSADAALIEVRLVRALVAMNSQLLEASTAPGASFPPGGEELRRVRARPPLVSLDARFAGRKPVPTGFNFSLPGNLVNFLMMNLLIFGGSTVAATRRDGTLRRMMTLPVRRGELVAGLIYGLILLGAAQIAFFVLVGRFVFDVSLGANLPAVILVLLVFSWVAAAGGVLVGSLLDAQDRVVGVCVLVSLLMAAIGGCWWPLEIAPDGMKTAAHFVPSGWALDALHQLISFGAGVDAVVVPLLVLAGFGVAATAAAAKFFRV